ncbi:MAG: DoxX family protein [Acidobacteriaceae bacterium]
MFRRIFATRDELTLTVARLALGVVLFAHGAQLMLGWFGGSGYAGSMQFFTQTLHMPAPLAWLAIVSQFTGSVALLLGFLTRIAALGIAIDMLVAIFKVHIHVGFFMNWAGTQKGEGYEYHLLALALCFLLMVKGAGAFSIDGAVYDGTR